MSTAMIDDDAKATRRVVALMRRNEPTAKQAAVLAYVVAYADEHGIPPTLREIGAEFGITSVNGVRQHLVALIRKGLLRSAGKGFARGHVPTPAGVAAVPPLERSPTELTTEADLCCAAAIEAASRGAYGSAVVCYAEAESWLHLADRARGIDGGRPILDARLELQRLIELEAGR